MNPHHIVEIQSNPILLIQEFKFNAKTIRCNLETVKPDKTLL